jgi:hypothetical protein
MIVVCLQVHASNYYYFFERGNHYYLLRVNVLFPCFTYVGKEKVVRLV